jgi:hypothetical protein
MKLHKLAHSFPNFGKKETPEEIAKYIEERRRRYPTKENIKKKVLYFSLSVSHAHTQTISLSLSLSLFMYTFLSLQKMRF